MNYEDNFKLNFKETFELYHKAVKAGKEQDLSYSDIEEILNVGSEEMEGIVSELEKTFAIEYYNNIENKIFFYGCPLDIYMKNYTKRKYLFLETFYDASEIDFIKSEYFDILEKHIYFEGELFPYPESVVNHKIRRNIGYSLLKTMVFLEKKANLLGYKQDKDDIWFFNKEKTEKTLKSSLKWKGNQSDLIELTKALIENGNLKGSQKDIFIAIQEFFNCKLENIDKTISTFNNRKSGNETKFLNELNSTLFNYINDKLEKNNR